MKQGNTRELLLRSIESYLAAHGYGPTVRELCEDTGLGSTATVHYHLRRLAQEGRILMDPGKKRAISLPRPAPVPRSAGKRQRRAVPVVGTVAAGQPILAEEDYDTFVTSPVECDVALEVEGESMVPTYLPGDIIYIKHQPTVRDGQVAVVLIDDEATLKHVYRDPDGLTLLSDNPDFPRIVVKGNEHEYIGIYGVPVGYTRIYKPDPLKRIKKGF